MSNVDVTALVSPLYIGNGVNRTKINTDGTITFEGAAVVYDDIQGVLTGANLYTAAGKADFDFDEQCVVLQSGGSITTSGDIVDITLQLRHNAKADTPLNLHIHWEQAAATTIQFTYKYRVQRNGLPKTTAWSSNVLVSTATNGVNSFTYTSGVLNQISSLGDIPLVGAGLSAVVQIKLARTDSNGGNINVTFIDGHYQIDALGSNEQFVKYHSPQLPSRVANIQKPHPF